jgi:hypothetical protein
LTTMSSMYASMMRHISSPKTRRIPFKRGARILEP